MNIFVLFCHNHICIELFVSQVTGTSCRLVNESTGQLVCEWRPPEGRNISVVAANINQVVAAAGQLIYYIVIQPGTLKLEA